MGVDDDDGDNGHEQGPGDHSQGRSRFARDPSRKAIPSPALFLSGKVFRLYRARGGRRTGVLPDVFIGAHALVTGVPLLTRDGRRYRTYFPTLDLILPEGLGNP